MKSDKIIDIWEGRHRIFFNFYHGAQKVTFGFPKKDTSFEDVYVKINDDEQPRISMSEAKSYLNAGIISMLAHRVKGLDSPTPKAYLDASTHKKGYGYCQHCGSALKGDKSKRLCYRCWKEEQD